VTALSGQHITSQVMEGGRVAAGERSLMDREKRIRELRQEPDGALYALNTEESGVRNGFAALLRFGK